MITTTDISIADYDYPLPEERIAKHALPQRDACKLLVYDKGEIKDAVFSQLSEVLPSGSMLVRNNTRVIRARLLFRKSTGATIEVFCLEPVSPAQYELSLTARGSCVWHCMVGNAKRWRSGDLQMEIPSPQGGSILLTASHDPAADGCIRFSWENDHYTFGEILEMAGILPIPPYLNRDTEEEDLETYQTVYAKNQGSVAAPTAGLHFTEEEFERLRAQGTPVVDVTLHVGAGTFRPVKSETIGEHRMHRELIVIERSSLAALRDWQGSIVAVGTTSVRTLESLYWLGRSLSTAPHTPQESLKVNQWEAYENEDAALSRSEAIRIILDWMNEQGVETLIFPTEILIAPGYRYRMVDAMITNFHQPRSTLLLLVSAFIGEDWKAVYHHALESGYRFLSYGDGSLLIP